MQHSLAPPRPLSSSAIVCHIGSPKFMLVLRVTPNKGGTLLLQVLLQVWGEVPVPVPVLVPVFVPVCVPRAARMSPSRS